MAPEFERNPSEAITFAEVWFDASKYLYGDKFHSTMNYIFRGALLDLANQRPVEEFVQALEMMQENYPPQVFRRLMNLVSSHDVPRAFFEIGFKNYGQQGYEEIKERYELIPFVQFTMPGAPTVYYGDEIGLTGGKDPLFPGSLPLGRGWRGLRGLEPLGLLPKAWETPAGA